MGQQEQFFSEMVARGQIRLSVRSLCLRDGRVLVQRPADDPSACYAFIGGRIELGELMSERLMEEYREELGVSIRVLRYLFAVENRFRHDEKIFHAIEHYFLVETESPDTDLQSRESHLTFHWLPLDDLKSRDLRPWVVRDALADGSWQTTRHLVVPFS